jgi:hypothetical protein
VRKVLPIDLPGEPDISSPLAFAEGLFSFINYSSEKEGFLISCIVYTK